MEFPFSEAKPSYLNKGTARYSMALRLHGFSFRIPSRPPTFGLSCLTAARQTRSLLETDQTTGGIDSRSSDLITNNDGRVTVWFGPQPPAGTTDHWAQTISGRSFNLMFRPCGPLEPWFDQSWRPRDPEVVRQPGEAPIQTNDQGG